MRVLEMLNYLRAEKRWVDDFINSFNSIDLVDDSFNSDLYNDLDLDLLTGEYQDADSYLDLDYGIGATKVVVCLKRFAFKTSYTDMVTYYNEDEYNDLFDYEKDECYRDGEFWFSKSPFYMGNTSDYCAVEEKVYQKALSYGVEDFFAETANITGTHIYVQERYSMAFDEYRGEEERPLSKSEISDIRKSCRFRFSDRVISWLANHYSSSELMKLGTFLKIYDINDLHDGNFAFFPDGKLRIIDYSGYCSSTSNLV